jgi:hypothetical protein
VAKVVAALQKTALLAFETRDRLEGPALTGLAGPRRLALRFQSMARVAERWRTELRDYADQVKIGRLEQAGDPAPRSALESWLEAQLEGPFATLVSTLRRLGVEVPPEDDPRAGLVA